MSMDKSELSIELETNIPNRPSLELRTLLNLEWRRNPVFRPNRQLNLNIRLNRESVLAQTRGVVADEACTRCARGQKITPLLPANAKRLDTKAGIAKVNRTKKTMRVEESAVALTTGREKTSRITTAHKRKRANAREDRHTKSMRAEASTTTSSASREKRVHRNGAQLSRAITQAALAAKAHAESQHHLSNILQVMGQASVAAAKAHSAFAAALEAVAVEMAEDIGVENLNSANEAEEIGQGEAEDTEVEDGPIETEEAEVRNGGERPTQSEQQNRGNEIKETKVVNGGGEREESGDETEEEEGEEEKVEFDGDVVLTKTSRILFDLI
ncbi:hypothetical protein PRK78_007547 [Emydomyces testavorans]|uniref:Uncharacterized protein n=1 Tax=Emydomyces testavorans TaxID=2070801 RepID=A0AAF0DQG1_9EURO|nr:hypothetical protein PRK78_007547 [Emydomyces testavorans]